jgi:hypothetical protein
MSLDEKESNAEATGSSMTIVDNWIWVQNLRTM